MERPLLVVTSDIHIRNDGKHLFVSKPFIEGDLIFAIEQLCQILKELKPKGFVIAGDFFHQKKISSGDLELASMILSTAKEVCDEVFYVQGQHDRFEPEFISVIDKEAVHLSPLEFKFYGKKIVGFDYCEDPLSCLEEVPEADILVTHQTWKLRSKEIFGKIVLSDLCSKASLTISGDIHSHCLWQFGANELIIPEENIIYRFPKFFISPGSICLQRLDAKENFGLFCVYDDLSVRSIKLKSRPIKILTFYSDLEVKNFKEKELPSILEESSSLPDYISKPLLIFKSNEFLPSINDLAMELEDKAFVCFEYSKIRSRNPDLDFSNPTIDGIIKEVFQTSQYKDIVELLFYAAKRGKDSLNDELLKLKKELEKKITEEAQAESN